MTATEPTTALDAVIVGAGFSGLYMLHKLRNEMGLTALVIEAGGGVGGTWWWNRYPGARSDSDSYIYGFMFDEELWKEWRWSERYPEQHEVRAYLEHVAQRYDLLRDITFNTRVQSATFDEDTGLWSLATDTGESIQTQHLIAANNGPVPEDVRQDRLADYEGIRERLQSSPFGHELTLLEKGALESTDEEVHEALMERWDRGGFGIWVGGYADILTSDEANAKARAFPPARTKEKGADPETPGQRHPPGAPLRCNPLPAAPLLFS